MRAIGTTENLLGPEATVLEARRLGCSSLSFRLLPWEEAIDAIVRLGFHEFDLGIYEGYCDHYDPLRASEDSRAKFVDQVRSTGLATRTLNVDPGHFSGSRTAGDQLWRALREEISLAVALGAVGISMATGEVRPGMDRERAFRQEGEGFRRLAALAADAGLICLVEAPHHGRVCDTVDAATRLIDVIDHPAVHLVLDTSHIVASGADVVSTARALGRRTRHVHLRDGRRGYVRLPVGEGEVDFAGFFRVLSEVGYEGHFTLELATEGSLLPKDEEVDQARSLVLSLWARRNESGGQQRQGVV
jgi:sugar phosphate isomerase/epimerase